MEKILIIYLVILFFLVVLLCMALEESKFTKRELKAAEFENRRLWRLLEKRKVE